MREITVCRGEMKSQKQKMMKALRIFGIILSLLCLFALAFLLLMYLVYQIKFGCLWSTMAVVFIFGMIFFFVGNAYRYFYISVTENSIIGNTFFSKKVFLPIESVIGAEAASLGGIKINYSSGSVRFYYIDNVKEITEAINSIIKKD